MMSELFGKYGLRQVQVNQLRLEDGSNPAMDGGMPACKKRAAKEPAKRQPNDALMAVFNSKKQVTTFEMATRVQASQRLGRLTTAHMRPAVSSISRCLMGFSTSARAAWSFA